jgi:hypothetical protein
MNYPAKEWREAIIDLGVEVDTHQDGDVFIRTFTFNEAQLQAFLDQHSAHLVERLESMRKKEKDEERDVVFDNGAKVRGQTHYPQNVGWNQALDQVIDIVKDK